MLEIICETVLETFLEVSTPFNITHTVNVIEIFILALVDKCY